MENRIIIAGAGGQGILFFGKLLAFSAMLAGKEVTWFPSYGAEMRGGTATCSVVISDEMIGSPVIKETDYLIVMNDASYSKYLDRLVPGGKLIYDSSMVKPACHRADIAELAVPASEMSSALGTTGAANMALAGSLASLSGLVSIDSICAALEEITPARRRNMMESNIEIIKRGYSIAKNS
jgi:2-oxoglutarate ferredoxin oxidoreductase subunit gamma